jgi:hypothetical protein
VDSSRQGNFEGELKHSLEVEFGFWDQQRQSTIATRSVAEILLSEAPAEWVEMELGLSIQL